MPAAAQLHEVTPLRVLWLLAAPLAVMSITAGAGAVSATALAYRLYRTPKD